MVLQNPGDTRDDVRDDQQRIFGCGLADVAVRQFNLEREFLVDGLFELVMLVRGTVRGGGEPAL